MDLGSISRKVRKFGKETAAEVQKMNDIRQINSKINDQKKQIAAIYSQIGQKLYKLYKEAPLEGFDAEFQKIEERLATIEVYNDQIREIKGVRICPNCHTEVSLHERYCSACGQKLPETLHIQKDEEGNTVIEGTGAEIFDVTEEQTGADEKEAKAGEQAEAAKEPAAAEEEQAAETEKIDKEAEAGEEPEAGEQAEAVKDPAAAEEEQAAETEEMGKEAEAGEEPEAGEQTSETGEETEAAKEAEAGEQTEAVKDPAAAEEEQAAETEEMGKETEAAKETEAGEQTAETGEEKTEEEK